MMSGKKEYKDSWELIEPPIVVDAVHNSSGARQALSFSARWRTNVEALWPGAGKVAFDRRTGQGFKEAVTWHLPAESLRLLRNDSDYVPKPMKFTATGKRRTIRSTRSPDDAQIEIMFDAPPESAITEGVPVHAVSSIAPPRRVVSTPSTAIVEVEHDEDHGGTEHDDVPMDIEARAFRRAAHEQFSSYQPPREEE